MPRPDAGRMRHDTKIIFVMYALLYSDRLLWICSCVRLFTFVLITLRRLHSLFKNKNNDNVHIGVSVVHTAEFGLCSKTRICTYYDARVFQWFTPPNSAGAWV